MLKVPPKSLCILRLSAIGDVCHTLPVVRAIARQLTDTSITWVIGAVETELVGDIQGIEFITVDKTHAWRSWRKLRQALAGRRFDCLLHMQYALRASAMSTAIRARERVGFDRRRARDGQWLFCNRRIDARQNEHVMDGLMGFARWLGITDLMPRWDIPIPQEAQAFRESVAPEDGRYVIVSPAASSASRNWLPERFSELITALYDEHDLITILTGSPVPNEVALCKRIQQNTSSPVINVAGKTSLKQLFALIRGSRLVIAPDSGPAHMGTAAGRPVVGLYAASNPLRTGPYLSRDFTVNRYPTALQAGYGKTVEEVRFGFRVRHGDPMSRISTVDVLEKVRLALKQRPQHGDTNNSS